MMQTNLPKMAAALFDMDGTLLDTQYYWRFTVLEYLLRIGEIPTPEEYARMYHTSGRKLCPELLAKRGIKVDYDAMVHQMERFMHRHYLFDAREKPGVRKLLDLLKARNIPMFVSTGSPREYARDALARLDLLDYFDFVTDGYEFGISKREPRYFEMMAQKLGIAVNELWVFEDAAYSMENARKAGCFVVGIAEPSQAHEREEALKQANLYFLSFDEMITCLSTSEPI